MISTFYLVQKNGVPAIWQAAPQRILPMLKRKAGFALASDTPSGTWSEALIKLRQVFPGQRRVKPTHSE